MTLSDQKQSFETFCESQGITITRTLDGDYSGAVLQRLWDAWRRGSKQKMERLVAEAKE